jgi:hypothetical protein
MTNKQDLQQYSTMIIFMKFSQVRKFTKDFDSNISKCLRVHKSTKDFDRNISKYLRICKSTEDFDRNILKR